MEVIRTSAHPVKAWVDGVEFEESAREQVMRVAELPFIHSHVAVMPDVHFGIGATVGSVIPTIGAIVPAAVGVDIGCGMVAQRTSLRAEQLPESLRAIRSALERTIPVGFNAHASGRIPGDVEGVWTEELRAGYDRIAERHPAVTKKTRPLEQLGTLGGGNHYVEVVIDGEGFVWLMLHSGSRGIGNRIGTFFIERARIEMAARGTQVPHRDLAWFDEGTVGFDEYVAAVAWAQRYARRNRDLMIERGIAALRHPSLGLPAFEVTDRAVNCHHNYVARERHFGADVYVTRKGAVRAGAGELGIIPGSMGARSFIVRGRGNPESFESCSHGAGRRMGRKEARRRLTVADLERETAGVECRKDAGVLDEAPSAYKSIDAVMHAQRDLVTVVHELKAVVCVKG